MNNFKSGKTALLAASLLAATGCAQKSELPNVLMIILDDAGYNDFGFMGCQDLDTPNIDSLAARGTIFSDAHVSATVSGPSRAGMLTGRYQQRNGYECNLENILGLGLEETTVADFLSEAGYKTSCIGKWHQGDGAEYHPNQRGFDHFYGIVSGGRSYFFNPKKDDKPGAKSMLQHNGEQVIFDGYFTDVLAEGANDFLKKHNQRDPFFMYLAFTAVHTPMEAAKEDLARYEGHPRQTLAAMTWALDRAIGSVVETLESRDMLDNTLIFFVSDNGGAHNNDSNNFPLKGFKGNKFEGGHRVPFFMVYGDKYKGKTFDGLTSSLDMTATALALAGVDTENLERPLDGVNLLPYLDGEVQGDPHEVLFWRKEDMAAARRGDYKLIRVEGVGERLYNVGNNHNEDIDLHRQHPQIVSELNEALSTWERELVNPLLWNEGIWNDVTREIHRDLMNNRTVASFTPEQFRRRQGKN